MSNQNISIDVALKNEKDFLKIFNLQTEVFFQKLAKKKNICKYLDELYINEELFYYNISKKNINKINKLIKQIEKTDFPKKINILFNNLVINNLKKICKLSLTFDYTIKKTISHKYSYHYKTQIVEKNGKKFVCKSERINKHDKKNGIDLSCYFIEEIKYRFKTNKFGKIMPKIIEIIILQKNNKITDIKYIYEYIDGKPLGEYLKKLNKIKKEKLYEKIIDVIKILNKNKISFGTYYEDLLNDILITKNNKIFFTGINYRNIKLNYNKILKDTTKLKIAFLNKEKMLEGSYIKFGKFITLILMEMIKNKKLNLNQ